MHKCFSDADKVIITDIYAAREKDNGEVHSEHLVEYIKKEGHDTIYINSFEKVINYLREHARSNDIILTMGAGNIYEVGNMLMKKSV